MQRLPRAHFVKSVLLYEDCPQFLTIHGQPIPEVALVGKSNVGKSSLINHLTSVARLAHTSSTPGKTQALNFYGVGELFSIVDLPGYGYASVPLALQKKWARWISDYFMKRKELKLILLLLDCRRDLSEEDLAMIQWALQNQKSLILLFTKADKCTPSEREKRVEQTLTQVNSMMGKQKIPHIFYSIREKSGRIQLLQHLTRALEL